MYALLKATNPWANYLLFQCRAVDCLHKLYSKLGLFEKLESCRQHNLWFYRSSVFFFSGLQKEIYLDVRLWTSLVF